MFQSKGDRSIPVKTKIHYHGYGANVPQQKRQANWVTALAATDTGALAGDVHGQLSSVSKTGRIFFTRKVSWKLC